MPLFIALFLLLLALKLCGVIKISCAALFSVLFAPFIIVLAGIALCSIIAMLVSVVGRVLR